METRTEAKRETLNPSILDPSEIRKEMLSEVESDKELEDKAEDIVAKLMGSSADEESRSRSKATVEDLGLDLQKEANRESEKLKAPIHKMSDRSEEGGEVAKSLIDLRVQVESLDPARFEFDDGFLTRLMGYLPFVGTPIKRYFSRYHSAQTVINAIVDSLEQGRELLKRDNITLGHDQEAMRAVTKKLQKMIHLGQKIDEKLQYRLDNEVLTDDPMFKFISEELLFPLRQRIQDLQQQLAVNQQGVLAMEMVIRNNKELIRGVNRALNVTINALRVAVTVALALADQKIVLDKVQKLNETTSELIASNARRLKEQGAEIQKMASTSQLDMDALKQAFKDVREAIEDISSFRKQALPKMAEAIIEMEKLTSEAEEVIKRKEEGSRSIEPIIPIEID